MWCAVYPNREPDVREKQDHFNFTPFHLYSNPCLYTWACRTLLRILQNMQQMQPGSSDFATRLLRFTLLFPRPWLLPYSISRSSITAMSIRKLSFATKRWNDISQPVKRSRLASLAPRGNEHALQTSAGTTPVKAAHNRGGEARQNFNSQRHVSRNYIRRMSGLLCCRKCAR
jgi:hypothetical protein